MSSFGSVETESNIVKMKIIMKIPLQVSGARNAVKDHIKNGRERNVLFNDALNTFYLRLYGVRHG